MKKKRYILFILLIAIYARTLSQTSISDDGSAPDQSAILDVKSTNKGILVPRMTQTQRNAIASPAEGLLVYQTDGNAGFYFIKSGIWTAITAGSNANIDFLSKNNDTIQVEKGSGFKANSIISNKIKSNSRILIKNDIHIKSDLISHGTIKPGVATSVICNSENVGSIRYNPTEGCMEFCNNNKWECIGGTKNNPCETFGDPNFSIKVNNLSTKAICLNAGDNFNLTSFQDGSWGGATYVWTGPDSFTNSSVTPPQLTMSNNSDGWYKCTIKHPTAPGCKFSDSVSIRIPHKIITQPQDLIMCETIQDSITLETSGNNLIYTWQLYNNSGDINNDVNWNNLNISEDNNLALSNNGNLIINNGNGLNGNRYRVRLTNTCSGIPLISSVVTLIHNTTCGPKNIVINHSDNNKNFDISWNVDKQLNNCRIEAYYNSTWNNLGTCDATENISNITYNLGENIGNWHTVSIRLNSNEGVYNLSKKLLCTPKSGSSSTTPLVDEDCNGEWNNTTFSSWGHTGTAYWCKSADKTNNSMGGSVTTCKNYCDTALPGYNCLHWHSPSSPHSRCSCSYNIGYTSVPDGSTYRAYYKTGVVFY